MKLIPKMREWIIATWYAILDYDTKTSSSKMLQTKLVRESAKERRLARDSQREAKSYDLRRKRQQKMAANDATMPTGRTEDYTAPVSNQNHIPITVLAHPSRETSFAAVSYSPPPSPGTMWCPFCSEEIRVEAIKCKHCGEFLDGRERANHQAPPQYSQQSRPVQVVVKQQTSGCTWIFIIALGIVFACVLMSVF